MVRVPGWHDLHVRPRDVVEAWVQSFSNLPLEDRQVFLALPRNEEAALPYLKSMFEMNQMTIGAMIPGHCLSIFAANVIGKLRSHLVSLHISATVA